MATDTSGVGSTTTPKVDRSKLKPVSDKFSDLAIEDFIKLMVTELQNQDPLNPMDNAQILQQMSQMQSIQSTQKLNTTLDSVLLGQNLSNAGSLIGKTIVGLNDAGKDVTGLVESVTIVSGTPRLIVGKDSIALNNVRLILPPEEADGAGTDTTTGDDTTGDTGTDATDDSAAA
ncbi:MAG: flagellar hook capping FlgD N-terminal domain-containing protein [Pirellulales bacterium]